MTATESIVKRYFLQRKRALMKQLGKDALYDDQIAAVAPPLLGPRWKGVYSHDQLPKSPGMYIINTAGSKSRNGIHWVAVYQTPKTMYVYDSYGRSTGSVLPTLKRRAGGRRIIESDRSDAEQIGTTSSICGHACIAWLQCVVKFGVRGALLV
jgi:hypothetical protein